MSKATKTTDTARVVRYIRDHPDCSVMEIRFALFVSAVTQRMSDARVEGIEFAKARDRHGVWRFRVVEPGQGVLWSEAS